ncbi:PEP/pyruvate-binding domain-containing protein [Candidatus Woesearchaeota archaeon]|nr:PEP/pyruvate-binding domain-containing protein [Candidatus Woesearchaeota archaeon]
MRYVLTLSNVKGSDLESAGFRAVDLGVLREKRLNIPLTFIINNQAFEDFLDENGLKIKIEKAFENNNSKDAYKEILELFSQADIPKDLEAELFEAYESLSIDPGASASRIVSEFDYPFITLIRSPSYLLSTEDKQGMVQNIKGKKALAQALKQAWASIYSPKSVDYRQRAGISDGFGLGVIVQKMKSINQSGVAYSCSEFDEKTIIVKSFLGQQDFDAKQEVLGKDMHEVDIDTLMIKKSEINVQEYSLVRSSETDRLVKHELGEKGGRQKLDDKQIAEIARITKRSKSFIAKDLKLYVGVRDAYTYVFLANRMVAELKRVTQEEEEVKAEADDKGVKITEHTYEARAGQEETLDIPEIISKEEARQEVSEEEDIFKDEEPEEDEIKKEEVKEEIREAEEEIKKGLEIKEEIKEEKKEEPEEKEEVDEELKKDLEFLEEIESDEVKKIFEEEVKEEEVQKEINLLEEVLTIKSITERMEEHALNHNKVAYEQEARKLHKMIDRVREGEFL